MTEKRYFKKEYEEQYFIFDSHIINEETISEFEEIDIRLFADSLTGDEVVNRLNELSEENDQLKKEKEFWKGDSCNCSNYLSILSMDCQIVQEAICNLKNVIDVDTEAFKLLDELDDKFDELNQHRIRHNR